MRAAQAAHLRGGSSQRAASSLQDLAVAADAGMSLTAGEFLCDYVAGNFPNEVKFCEGSNPRQAATF